MALVFLVLIVGFGGPVLLGVLICLIDKFRLPGVIVMVLIFVALLSVASWVDILFGAMTLAAIGGFLLPYLTE